MERSGRSCIKRTGPNRAQSRCPDGPLEEGLRLRGPGPGRWDWKPISAGEHGRTACAHRNWAGCGLTGSLVPPIFSETLMYPCSIGFQGQTHKAGKVCVRGDSESKLGGPVDRGAQTAPPRSPAPPAQGPSLPRGPPGPRGPDGALQNCRCSQSDVPVSSCIFVFKRTLGFVPACYKATATLIP